MSVSRIRGNQSIFKVILVPSLISLVVTLWRLTGELMNWSESWFSPEPGGAGAIIGITWLAPIFGVLFAHQLVKEGQVPRSWKQAIGFSLLGLVFLFMAAGFQSSILYRNWIAGLAFIWLVGLVAAAVQLPAWPELYRTLAAYALAARIPVLVIMFLAFRGRWGTHYDAVPPGLPEMGWLAHFVWLGLFPQIFFWVSFTIVTGMFLGTFAAAVVSRRRPVAARGSKQPGQEVQTNVQ